MPSTTSVDIEHHYHPVLLFLQEPHLITELLRGQSRRDPPRGPALSLTTNPLDIRNLGLQRQGIAALHE
eukprot:7209077-Pyramimonas_sp.AAC.1